MKAITTLSIISLLFTSLISCKKDSVPANLTPTPDPGVSTGNYLSKMSFSYDDGSGVETADRNTTYVYDNLKRLSKMIDSSSNSSGSWELWQVTDYFYQGNDTLPYKSIITGNQAAQIEYDTATDYYTYNNAGRLVRDTGFYISVSTGVYSVSSNQTYTYSGSVITGRRDDNITYSGNSYTEVRIDTAQTDGNGNIIHNIKHRGSDVINSTLTWDNHPSPFAKLSNFHSSFKFPFGETFFYELPQNNNRLHITEITSGSSSYSFEEDFTGKYTYNSDGYPTQILEPDASSGGYDKVVFEYRSL